MKYKQHKQQSEAATPQDPEARGKLTEQQQNTI